VIRLTLKYKTRLKDSLRTVFWIVSWGLYSLELVLKARSKRSSLFCAAPVGGEGTFSDGDGRFELERRDDGRREVFRTDEVSAKNHKPEVNWIVVQVSYHITQFATGSPCWRESNSTIDLLVLTRSDQLLFTLKNKYFSLLQNKEVNCTEPPPLVSVPCVVLTFRG
jgi:hypothetical protein